MRTRLQPRILLTTLLVAWILPASASPADPTSHRWELLLDNVPRMGALAPDGRLWLVRRDGLYRTSHPYSGSVPADRIQWERTPTPPDITVTKIDFAPSGETWIAARDAGRHRDTVGRLTPGPDGFQWREYPVPAVASIMTLDVDSDGRPWVGGEWGELFRLEPQGWVKEMLPVQHHVEHLRVFEGGIAWAVASTRSLYAVVRREADRWQLFDLSRDRQANRAIYATRDELWVHGVDGVDVWRADGSRSKHPDPSLGGNAASRLYVESPHRIFSRSTAGLFLGVDGSWTKLDQTWPGDVIALQSVEGVGVHVITLDDRLYRLVPGHEAPESIGPDLEQVLHRMEVGDRVMGLTVVRYEDGERLYVVDHEGMNPTIAPDDESRAGEFAADRYPGNEGSIASTGEMFTYDVTALAADFDGDAREDLILLSMYDYNRLYLRNADETFRDATGDAGIAGSHFDDSTGGCLLDADGDGDLDVYVANTLTADVLWLNNGAATFRSAPENRWKRTGPGSVTATCADLDLDGDTDVVVATWGRGLLVHENHANPEGWAFTTHRLLTDDGATSLHNINSVAVADFDGDRLPDLFLAQQSDCDKILINRGGLAFRAAPEALPAGRACGYTKGASVADFDHDGDLDLAVNGEGGGWFLANEGGRFVEVGAGLEPVPGAVGAGSVVFDLDADGDPDLCQAGLGVTARLFRNKRNDDRWLRVRVEGPPANTSATGAQVALFESGGIAAGADPLAVRQIGATGGYASMDSKEVHFGGLTPGAGYEIRVTLPGARAAVVGDLAAASRASVSLDEAGLLTIGGVHGYRARTFLGNRWNRAVALAAVLLVAALVWAARAARRRDRPIRGIAGFVAVQPVLMLTIYLYLSPALGGPIRVASALGVSGFLAGIGLLLLPRVEVPRTAGTAQVVDVAVRVRLFGHNRLGRRLLDGLLFTLRNLPPIDERLDPERTAAVKENLSALQSALVPQVRELDRLARQVLDEAGPDLESLTNRFSALCACRDEDLNPALHAHRSALIGLLQELPRWTARLKNVTDRHLALDLGDAIGSFVESRKHVYRGELVFDPPAEPYFVRFPRADLEAVLDGLLDNAAQASEGRRVTVRFAIRSGARGRIALFVEDNGPGIPDEHREAVFRPDFSTSGGGFGLAHARDSLRRMGATIDVEPGRGGARFRLELEPLEAPEWGARRA